MCSLPLLNEGKILPLRHGDDFSFACHPGVPCFTECCRMLELVLTPYDVLRLKKGLGISSREFLERYAIIEYPTEIRFPQVYLTMVDDGRASCPFVDSSGCTVYKNRPGACRFYPVGRGASLDKDNVQEQFVLLQEPHCKGFKEKNAQNLDEWAGSQEIKPYVHFNDLVMRLTQDKKMQLGITPDQKKLDTFLLALYNLDRLREEISCGMLSGFPDTTASMDDEQLLEVSIAWVHDLLQN